MPADYNLANNSNICTSVNMPLPPPTCLMSGSSPRIITATDTNPSQGMALTFAQNSWTSQATQAGGPDFGNFNRAAHQSVNCTTSQGNFFNPGQTTCVVSGQPCK